MRNPSNSSMNLFNYTKKVIMNRHYRILKRKKQLQDEITELKRQLKIHPMGVIVLHAHIKEKQIEIKNLNAEKLTRIGYPQRKKSLAPIPDQRRLSRGRNALSQEAKWFEARRKKPYHVDVVCTNLIMLKNSTCDD